MSAVSNSNPFPGLRSFEREQAHLFFGRDDQIRDLSERLSRNRFLPIVGMSGSGKSSLVRAGLIPALTGSYVATETPGWRIAMLRPGRNPMHELAEKLSSEFAALDFAAALQTLQSSSAGLARIAQEHLVSKQKLLVLVDQFEELFRYGEHAEPVSATNDAAAFVKLLLGAAGQGEHPLPGFDDLPVYVVTTMRSDFLGKCSRFRGLPEALNRSQYLIPRLTREQQREVVEGPIEMEGASIEPALVQRLLTDLGDNPDQLPALQHALMRTWEQSAESRIQGKPITIADYEAVGGMADALNRDADQVLRSLATDAVAETITRRLFQRLVQPGAADGETRAPTPLSELVAVTAATEDDVKRVIKVFQERGFLTVSGDDDPIIDIPHESLIRGWHQLATWVQEEMRSAAIYRRLADQAALYADKQASLLSNPQLQLTVNWLKETKPNRAWAARYDSRFVEAMAFLTQSQIGQRRRLVQSWAAVSLIIFLVVSAIFTVILLRRALAEREQRNRALYDTNIQFASLAVASGQFAIARERVNELLEENLRALRGFELFYLWRAVHADKATLTGHFGSVSSVAFSPDGKMMATASADKTVILWDTARDRIYASLSGHKDRVVSVAFSPDGKTLASASFDKTVKLWKIATLLEPITLSGHTNHVLSVAFSPDGKILVSSDDDGKVKLWDTATHTEMATLSGHSFSANAVAFSPDGKTLASAGNDNKVILWDIPAHKEITTLFGHNGPVLSVAFSHDGKLLASGSFDKTVKLWDIATRKAVGSPLEHSDYVFSVAFSPDDETLASASKDKTLKLWNMFTREEVATLFGHSDFVRSVTFSPDGKTLASASDDKTVKLWDVAAPKNVTTLSAHSEGVRSIAFSPDGKTVASGSYDNTAKLWDLATHKEVATLSGHSKILFSVTFSPDGKTLASASADKTVKLWDTATHNVLATLSGHSNEVTSVAFSPDGTTLASASKDKTVKLWDVAAHKVVATLVGHSDEVWSVAFSPDGKTLASGSADRTVRLWDTATRRELVNLFHHAEPVYSVAFSPDGKIFASGSADNTIQLWDAASHSPLANLSGHSDKIWSVVFSPDSKTLASSSDDKTVKLWDITAFKELATLSGHTSWVWSVAFSPDGKTLASSSDDETVKLWFAATDHEIEQRRYRGY
jgi:WD40 repeat protein/energy-coupling factor transporter ATP-binding protein EcfA2